MSRNRQKKSNRKASRGLKMAGKLMAIVYLVALFIFEFSLMVIDILPLRYLLIGIAVLTLISIVIFLQLFLSKVKRRPKKVALGLSIVLTVCYIGLSSVLGAGIDMLSHMSSSNNTGRSDIMDKPFTILVSGLDNKDDEITDGRSDVNMLVTVNPKTEKILMVSIPRDYYVYVPEFQSRDKLTHTGMYGIDTTIDTVQYLFNDEIPIDYDIRVNFLTVVKMIDAIGGVDVDSEVEFDAKGRDYTEADLIRTWHFVKGENHLDGSSALAFARERYSFQDGDVQRAKNEQLVLQAIIRKMTSSKTLLTKYDDILDVLGSNIKTSLSPSDMSAAVRFQLANMPKWDMESMELQNGGDGLETVYSVSGNVYVMYPDDQSIQEAKNAILDCRWAGYMNASARAATIASRQLTSALTVGNA